MNTNDLAPGRELDALIAEKVMGFVIADVGCGSDVVTGEEKFKEMIAVDERDKDTYLKAKVGENLKYFKEIPNYSTDISAAWEVVDKFPACFRLEKAFEGGLLTGWVCEGSSESELFVAIGQTAAHAICLAALKAVENV